VAIVMIAMDEEMDEEAFTNQFKSIDTN